jgi:hypothetical protein
MLIVAIGIGFSDHNVPVVVEHCDPLLGWRDVGAVGGHRDTYDSIASRIGVSFHETRIGYLPDKAASIFSIAWSMVKLAAFCRGGYSSNVFRKSVITVVPAKAMKAFSIRNSK